MISVWCLQYPGGSSGLLIFVAGLWFVNLVNFMDGIDWMTAAEVVPLAAALAALGWLGALPPYGLVTALALGGAMTGFAWFNRPVATLFLGDVGSLPIGLLLGWLLLSACRRRSFGRSVDPAALLSCRRHHHAAAAARAW